MRRTIIAVVAAAAMAIPASFAVVGVATPAGAASSLTCSKIKRTLSGTVSISKCTPLTRLKGALQGGNRRYVRLGERGHDQVDRGSDDCRLKPTVVSKGEGSGRPAPLKKLERAR